MIADEKNNSSTMTLKKKFLSFSAVLLTIILLAQTASALTFNGFFANPVTKGKTWFTYEMEPGDSVKDYLVVTNNQNTTQSFYIYPADLSASTDGGFAIKQRKEEMKDIGKWIELEETEVTLTPRSSQKIAFTLTVPNDEKIDVGEHAGGIAIEEKPASENNSQQGIVIHKRVGTRVYVTIPGEIIKDVQYESFKKDISKFRSFVIPKIYKFSVATNNIGNVSNKIEIVFNAKNILTGKIHTQKYSQMLTRETRGVSNFNWKAPFCGIYKFSVDGKYQTLDGEGVFKTDTLIGIIIPWDLILLLIILVIFGLQGYKKYKTLYSGENWKQYTVKSSDTVTELAEKYSVTWRQIVKVNKIKAPYSIKSGEKILLPIKTPKSRK